MPEPRVTSSATAVVILAGGRGSRMGGASPKPLMRLAGRPLIAWVLDALPAGLGPTIVNAAADAPYTSFGHPVVPDLRDGHAGPLAGLEASARWLSRESPRTTHMLALPADTPFLTPEILDAVRLPAGPLVRVARHAGRLHPTVALWPLARLAALAARLDDGRNLSLMGLLDTVGFEAVDVTGDDPFFNVNTPDDLSEAARRLVAG